MQALFRRIERVAPIDVPVLICGESGTGKELVAAAIQRLSVRHHRRYEPVNCAALPRELLLSELFGHERGAFTGAVGRKPGLLTLADHGTVFLDEIGDLAPDAQAMLLRFLQNGEVRPVGGTRTVKVDVRLISATHRDLAGAIARREFREDLYHRLCDIVLEVPPLRARERDLPLLVEYFRRQFNEQHGLSVGAVCDAAMVRLAAHPWPGNVRELEKVLKEAMILCREGDLEAADVEGAIQRRLPRRLEEGHGGRRPTGGGGGAPGVGDRGEVALRLARERGSVSRGDLARACGISGETARQELAALTRLGRLRRVGEGRRTQYVPA